MISWTNVFYLLCRFKLFFGSSAVLTDSIVFTIAEVNLHQNCSQACVYGGNASLAKSFATRRKYSSWNGGKRGRFCSPEHLTCQRRPQPFCSRNGLGLHKTYLIVQLKNYPPVSLQSAFQLTLLFSFSHVCQLNQLSSTCK